MKCKLSKRACVLRYRALEKQVARTGRGRHLTWLGVTTDECQGCETGSKNEREATMLILKIAKESVREYGRV